MELDWKSIVIFLNMEGKNATKIHKEIKHVLPQNVPSYPTITRILWIQKILPKSNPSTFLPKNQYQEENCDIILQTLKNFPYASVRQIEKVTGIPKSTIYDVLTKSLGYVARHLKWVPHFLNNEQKKKELNFQNAYYEKFKKQENILMCFF